MENLTGRRLMVVAHPDDETMWGAGIILRNPGDWTVLCCSVPMSDPVRAVLFRLACERLGAYPIVIEQPDQYGVALTLDIPPLDDWDVVVTHGPNGEYGHPHHVQVHGHVKSRRKGRLITFWGDQEFRLSPAEAAGKAHALKAYDHILPYDGVAMPKWAALLQRYGRQWLELESYGG